MSEVSEKISGICVSRGCGRSAKFCADCAVHDPDMDEAALSAQLASAREALKGAAVVFRSVEWAADYKDDDACPECFWTKSDGHASRCLLISALARIEKELAGE